MNNDGEIKINSQMGSFLYNISLNSKYTKYVETGTKCGNGSTYCFLKGLLQRNDNSCLYSYETNRSFFLTAMSNLSSIDNNKLILNNKTLVSYEELPEWEYWNNIKKEDYNYNKDLNKCDLEDFILNIDVMLLDSGGWSRQAEWNKYKNHIKVIIIDDTKISTSFIRNEILNDSSWNVLHDRIDDRNGWLAAEKNC